MTTRRACLNLSGLPTATRTNAKDDCRRTSASRSINYRPPAQGRIEPAVAAYYFRADYPKLKALPADVTPQWLSDNSSFGYLGANRPNSIEREKDLVIAFEKYEDRDDADDVLVAFADASVTTVPKREAVKMIADSKNRLAAIKPMERYRNEPVDWPLPN